MSPRGFHKIAAFRLTFIQSLQWICKGNAIEKHFKPLRSDANTTTGFNELRDGDQGEKSILSQWKNKLVRAHHVHTPSAVPAKPTLLTYPDPHSTRYKINSVFTRCRAGAWLTSMLIQHETHNCNAPEETLKKKKKDTEEEERKEKGGD